MTSSVDGGDIDDSVCFVLVCGFCFEIPYVTVYNKMGTKMECRYQHYPMKQKGTYIPSGKGCFYKNIPS
jgi:hypothetical protein